MITRLDREALCKWHIALNKYNVPGKDFMHWMYEAKTIPGEFGRMLFWFALERQSQLPKFHQQCSQQEPEPIDDNYLTCCLGQKCKLCPHLVALESAELTSEVIDEIKAWTCIAHIITQVSKGVVDTSEGYIQSIGDRMFWDNVYKSLAGLDALEPEEGDEP